MAGKQGTERAGNAHRSGNPAIRAAADRYAAETGRSGRVTWRDWVGGARLRTLPLALAPIAAATGVVQMMHQLSWPLTLLALAVAVFLQIGVNYANDYSDGIRGTDEFRVGPARLTGSGHVDPKSVLRVALVFFALAAVAGLTAVILSERWWFLAIGAVAIVAAWFYTGGKRPYGYMALGEVFVFLFFGLVATLGTVWLQADELPQEAWLAAIGVGLFAVATLISNNIRDIPTDTLAGKRTLSVLVGKRVSQILYTACVLLPFVIVFFLSLPYVKVIYAWFVLALVLPAILILFTARRPKEEILVLKLTSFAGLAYGLTLGYGIGW